jgi:hypothetical protein
MLSEKFDDLLIKIGNPNLEKPIFYNASVGIRFEIGNESPIYLEGSDPDTNIVNHQYIAAALQRAKAIYTALPHAPNLLRIDTYPKEEASGRGIELDPDALQSLFHFPHEQRSMQVSDDDEEYTTQQLYWNLDKLAFSPDLLLREIIKADLGGISSLASSVYFANTEDVYLYHIYDDRGADLVAESKELLRPIYHNFYPWILDYDKKRIDKLFVK